MGVAILSHVLRREAHGQMPVRSLPAQYVAAVALGILAVAGAGPEECELSVVGAGVGGAYAAWRAASEGMEVCVFEMNDRLGGRIHSLRNQGPKKDLVVEAGAYRFTATTVCNPFIQMCMDTPITRALVRELGIPSAIYDKDSKISMTIK